jgi:dipeptidyl aminopeptidase/acylaminoacyl peptidase
MPGEENGEDELYYFEVPTKALKQIPIEKWKNQNLSSVRWGKTPDDLYFNRQDRTLDWYDICLYNPSTNEAKVLIEEHIDKSTIETKGINFINDFNEIIWWSERSGWGHFYLYDSNGNLKNQITSGDFQASGIVRIDTAQRIIYFNGNGDNYPGKPAGEWPYYSHLFRVNFDGTGLKLLNPEDATHSINISPTNAYFVDNYNRVDLPPKSVLRDNMGNLIMELEETDNKALLEYGWKYPERFVVKSADGITDIYGVMWKPFDFDPKKKYPIITNVYPGPQTESISFTYSPSGGTMQLAQLGFIVINIGNRGGSPQRSLAYHRYEMTGAANFRDYGLADKKAGIEQLAARFSFIDIDKVGIYGHSGGGFMTGAAMLVPPYNEFFKVGVASSGNHDNNIYNQPWSEDQAGGEWTTVRATARGTGRGGAGQGTAGQGAAGQSAAGQAVTATRDTMIFNAHTANNPEMAANLKGHLLLTHGTMDNNVHPANSIRLADALIRAGKRFDYMPMPGQPHGYGEMQPYFTKMLWDYFCLHLLGICDTSIDMVAPIQPRAATPPAIIR